MTRVLVVGGGILGTMDAWEAVRRGHDVCHLERERQARGATVRNFGLIWVSGRSAAELPDRLVQVPTITELPAVLTRSTGPLVVHDRGRQVVLDLAR